MYLSTQYATRPTVIGDIMTNPIIQVAGDTSAGDALWLLGKHRIGAIPVIDAEGRILGMASRSDLLSPSPDVDPENGISAAGGRTVAELMHTPVVTIAEDAAPQVAARLMRVHAIRQLPVLRAGRVVGIVADADLLRIVEHMPMTDKAVSSSPGWGDMVASLFGSAERKSALPDVVIQDARQSTAALFRRLVGQADQDMVVGKAEARQCAKLKRSQRIKVLLDKHLLEDVWIKLMVLARVTAASGGREIQLLRFPAALCEDGGRKINNADPAWAATLRGEAAELYKRYVQELKPAGFTIVARVADYPDGMPGDVAIFLVWLQ